MVGFFANFLENVDPLEGVTSLKEKNWQGFKIACNLLWHFNRIFGAFLLSFHAASRILRRDPTFSPESKILDEGYGPSEGMKFLRTFFGNIDQ